MTQAFIIKRPDGEIWELVPQTLHESKYAQWWQLIRNGVPGLYNLLPKKYGRREIIEAFETALDPNTPTIKLR